MGFNWEVSIDGGCLKESMYWPWINWQICPKWPLVLWTIRKYWNADLKFYLIIYQWLLKGINKHSFILQSTRIIPSLIINLIYINMDLYGKYHDVHSTWKHNPKNPFETFKNSLTRRNKEIAESTTNCTKEHLPVCPAHLSPQQASSRFGSIATCAGWSLTFSRSTKCNPQTMQPAQDHSRAG